MNKDSNTHLDAKAPNHADGAIKESTSRTPELTLTQRLNLQTARIAWSELEKFFAAGKAICIDSQLDLIDVAAAIHNDDTTRIHALMQDSKVGLVTDQQALNWSGRGAELWAVVVSPWVLVQLPS